MNIVVCIKQVPEAGDGVFDPASRRLDRSAGPNVVNPFDRRAIALAVDLTRRFGGSSVALTLGPPQAREVLLEALASGIDRAVHLCDPAFAGSDTLVTARALTAAIQRLPYDLVLCGKCSVDGETGQVGPEIATLLGLPQITGARRLTFVPIDAEPARVEAERESDEGYECVEAALPVVVTTAERLIQPIRVESDALTRAAQAPIDSWTAADLGFVREAVGQAGSPTVVLELREHIIRRPPVRMNRGPVEDQAQVLAELIATWRGRDANVDRRRPLPVSPPIDNDDNDDAAVWVVAERRANGRPSMATLELLGEAAWLAHRLGGYAAAIVLDADYPELASLATHGADRVVHLRAPELGSYTPENYAAALVALLTACRTPHAVLFSASERGRDVAPRVAATLGLGLTGDCIGLTLDRDGRLQQLKPALGTSVVAPIWSRTTPQLATVRPGTFALPLPDFSRSLRLQQVTPVLAPVRTTVLKASVVELDPSWRRLEGAPAVVGVGSGIGGPEFLPLVCRFAALFGAAIGATRRVTDRGWLPRSLQIGLTGRSVAPELYVAVGVRGAPSHTIGIQRAHTIVALNLAAQADIFRIADVGFVADFRPMLERTCVILEGG